MAIDFDATESRARTARRREVGDVAGVGSVLRRLDWLLVAALAAVVAYGLWAINGITLHDPGGSALSRQVEYAVAGSCLFVAALFVDPDRYRRLTRPIYFGTLGVMLFVLAAGAATPGSVFWISIE